MPRRLLAVIMPSYNAKRLFAGSIDPVVPQTVDNWELIIVDEIPCAVTFDIVAEVQPRDLFVRPVSERANHRPTRTGTHGPEQACADVSTSIDSDDVSFPEITAKQVAEIWSTAKPTSRTPDTTAGATTSNTAADSHKETSP